MCVWGWEGRGPVGTSCSRDGNQDPHPQGMDPTPSLPHLVQQQDIWLGPGNQKAPSLT